MSVQDAELPAHWKYYADRSREAHSGRCDDYGSGREEQLNETLDFIESGKPFTKSAQTTLDRMPQNRSKKYTRLRDYIFARAAISCKDDHEPEIERVFTLLTTSAWEIECRLAEGEEYTTIAKSGSVNALKMRVSRLRAVIRAKLAA